MRNMLLSLLDACYNNSDELDAILCSLIPDMQPPTTEASQNAVQNTTYYYLLLVVVDMS